MAQHPKFQHAADGTLLINFGTYGQEVEVAAISGDGLRILTVCSVGKAEVWDVSSGAKVGDIQPDSPLRGAEDVAPFRGPFEVFIESASLNRDGSIALLGLNDGTAGTFRVSDGVRLAVLHPPNEQPGTRWGLIRAVAFSPDDSLVIVGFWGRAVGVWTGYGAKAVAFLVASLGARIVRPWFRGALVSSVAVSEDNRWVFAGCADLTASIWDIEKGETVFEAVEHAEDMLAIFDSSVGFGWATTGGSVWQSSGDAPMAKRLASCEHWAEAAFHRDVLLTRGAEGTIHQHDGAGQGAALFRPSEEETAMWSDRAQSLAFHGDRGALYPEGGRRLVVRMDGERTAIQRDAQIVTARFRPQGDAVAVGGWTDSVELWSIPDGKLVRTFAAVGDVGDFAFSPDGELLAVGEIGHGGGRYPRTVTVYETATGREVHRHTEHDWQVSLVTFSPNRRWLASLGHEVLLWNLDSADHVREHRIIRIDVDRVTAAAQFLPDGRLLVLDQGRARVFREGSELLNFEVPVGFQTRWCVSEDGRRLNIGVNQGVARFELETGRCIGLSMAPMPRPEQLPSARIAEQAAVRVGALLWRTDYGVFLHQSDGPRGWVEPLALSSSGEVVVPTGEGAAVMDVASNQVLLGEIPFDGKLRSTRIVNGEILLMNEKGRLFRANVPVNESVPNA